MLISISGVMTIPTIVLFETEKPGQRPVPTATHLVLQPLTNCFARLSESGEATIESEGRGQDVRGQAGRVGRLHLEPAGWSSEPSAEADSPPPWAKRRAQRTTHKPLTNHS